MGRPAVFDGRYIALIQNDLTDGSVARARKVKDNHPMQFHFDGGDGLLMPMSRPLGGMPVVDATLN